MGLHDKLDALKDKFYNFGYTDSTFLSKVPRSRFRLYLVIALLNLIGVGVFSVVTHPSFTRFKGLQQLINVPKALPTPQTQTSVVAETPKPQPAPDAAPKPQEKPKAKPKPAPAPKPKPAPKPAPVPEPEEPVQEVTAAEPEPEITETPAAEVEEEPLTQESSLKKDR